MDTVLGLQENPTIENPTCEKMTLNEASNEAIKSPSAIKFSNKSKQSLLHTLYENVPEFMGNREQILSAFASICDYLQLVFAFLQFTKRR